MPTASDVIAVLTRRGLLRKFRTEGDGRVFTVMLTASPAPLELTLSTVAGNGPMPATDSRARRASKMIAPVTATNTEPWT